MLGISCEIHGLNLNGKVSVCRVILFTMACAGIIMQ